MAPIAKHRPPERTSKTASSPTWPAMLFPSSNCSLGMPDAKSGPLGLAASSLMIGLLR